VASEEEIFEVKILDTYGALLSVEDEVEADEVAVVVCTDVMDGALATPPPAADGEAKVPVVVADVVACADVAEVVAVADVGVVAGGVATIVGVKDGSCISGEATKEDASRGTSVTSAISVLILARVLGPTIPIASIPFTSCNFLTAASVLGP